MPVVNIAGVAAGQLKLTPEVLADLFLGKISKWNDSRVPALILRGTARSGGYCCPPGGWICTSFIFTNYLSKVSAEWKQKAGEEASVQWPYRNRWQRVMKV